MGQGRFRKVCDDLSSVNEKKSINKQKRGWQRSTRSCGTSPESIAAMTGVPAKAVESVRSDWGAIFGVKSVHKHHAFLQSQKAKWARLWRSRARFDRLGCCCCCSCCCMRRTYPRLSSGSGPIRRIRSLIRGRPATSGKPMARKSEAFVAFRAPHVGHLRPNGWTAVSCQRLLFFDVLTRAASNGFRQCRSKASPR